MTGGDRRQVTLELPIMDMVKNDNYRYTVVSTYDIERDIDTVKDRTRS